MNPPRFSARIDRGAFEHDKVTVFANGANTGTLIVRKDEAEPLRDRLAIEYLDAPLLPTSSGAFGMLAFLQGFIAQTGEKGGTLAPSCLVGLANQIDVFLKQDRPI